jgi:hypothetical protein
MIRIALGLGLIAFVFYGSGTGKPHTVESFGYSEHEKDASFAQRFDAVYATRFACRTDTECEAVFRDYLEAFDEDGDNAD